MQRLGLTVEFERPDEWPIRVSYDLLERGGRSFMGGPGIASQEPGGHRVQLPLELLPELARLDLGSGDAVVGFIQKFGPLVAWPNRFLAMRTGTFGSPPAVKLGPLYKVREELRGGNDHLGEFLEEFRVAAGGLVSLFETVLELEGEIEGRRRFSADRLARRWSRFSPWPSPATKGACWRLLVDTVNEGLRSSPLTLWYIRDGEPTGGWDPEFKAGPPFLLHPSQPETLYGVCILELVDHVLSVDRPYRICANETCGRLFSVQEGRSRFGGHRTDTLKYHTPACKSAQEQREYRRRQAAKKEGRAK